MSTGEVYFRKTYGEDAALRLPYRFLFTLLKRYSKQIIPFLLPTFYYSTRGSRQLKGGFFSKGFTVLFDADHPDRNSFTFNLFEELPAASNALV